MARLTSGIKKGLRGARGFTLIELLVVCLVAGILGGAMLAVYEGLIRSAADTEHRVINQDDARSAVNTMARYMRMAESSASNLTSQTDAIAVAGQYELVFYADIDGNGLPEKVRYYLSGKTLWMANVAPITTTSPPTYPTSYSSNGVVIMDGIQNGTTAPVTGDTLATDGGTRIFTYFKLDPLYDPANPNPTYDRLQPIATQSDGSIAAADLKSILAVGITLYVNDSPAGISKGNVALKTLIQVRQRYNGGLSGS